MFNRAPEIYFQFDDEVDDGILLDGGERSVSHSRENGSKSNPGISPVTIDVNYRDDFIKSGMAREPFDESKLKTILVWNNVSKETQTLQY